MYIFHIIYSILLCKGVCKNYKFSSVLPKCLYWHVEVDKQLAILYCNT